MFHAVIFGFIWAKTKSLAVATVYHAAFDEIRDSIEHSTGYGSFVELWQMGAIIIIGSLLWWKADWSKLLLSDVHEINNHAGIKKIKVHLEEQN